VSRNDRNILILGVLVILLLVVGYYFLLLSPLQRTLDERAQERDDKEAQLASLQQQVAELEAARDNAPEIERQLLELSKRIPEQPEVPTLVVQIEEIADASGVTQVLIQPGSPGPPAGGGEFTVLPVTMSFEGTYEELQDFLFRTRNLARLVTVNEVSYCEIPPEGERIAEGCPIPEVEFPEGAEATVLEDVEGPLLQVGIEAEVYFQPESVPEGPAPVAPATREQTTPEGTTDAE
jgi:type IV pilus assembly protein PilO